MFTVFSLNDSSRETHRRVRRGPLRTLLWTSLDELLSENAVNMEEVLENVFATIKSVSKLLKKLNWISFDPLSAS